MKNFATMALGGFGVLGFVAGLVYLGYHCYKLHQTAKKLDSTVDDLSRKESIDIQQDMVRTAVETAVDREVHDEIRRMSDRLGSQVRSDMLSEIRKNVREHYNEVKSEVSDKISEEVAAIDVESLRKTVVNKAERRVAERFDGTLDGVLDNLKHTISAVNKLGAVLPMSGGSRPTTIKLE